MVPGWVVIKCHQREGGCKKSKFRKQRDLNFINPGGNDKLAKVQHQIRNKSGQCLITAN